MSDAIKLLIIETSKNVAESYNKALISSGTAILSITLETAEDLSTVLIEEKFDLIIFNINNPLLAFEQLIQEINTVGVHAGIILVANNEEEMKTPIAILHGARDLVYKDNLDHLVAVVLREHQHVILQNDYLTSKFKVDELNARCHTLMDSSREAIAYVHEGMHIYANTTYLDKFGYKNFEELEGESLIGFIPKDNRADFKKILRDISQNPSASKNTKATLQHQNGEQFDIEIEFSPASIDGEDCTQVILRENLSNTVNEAELEAQLEELSKIDSLSKLLNRVAFLKAISSKIANIKDSEQYALLQIGIDGFDKIQNQLGLMSCDQVISEMGGLIKANMPQDCISGRSEGHIFKALVPFQQLSQIEAVAQKLIDATESHIVQTQKNSINMSCSIGIAVVDDKRMDVDEIVSRTNKAYEEALEKGTSQQQVYKPSADEMSQQESDNEWARQIKLAVSQNKFKLFFQPMIKLEGNDKEHYEVLMKMMDDEGKAIPAEKYLPAAERAGLTKIIDRWVLMTAFKRLKTLLDSKPNSVFFIKLTSGSLSDTGLFKWIQTSIKELQLPAQSLVFEVKETAVLSHLKQAQMFSDLLKTINCRFAIDDFGTGPDPFKLVNIIPADFLKFSKDFTKNLSSSTEDQKNLKEIAEVARGLNKQTVIKHVEDAATLSVLWTIGADFTQGNFFQEPSEIINFDFSA